MYPEAAVGSAGSLEELGAGCRSLRTISIEEFRTSSRIEYGLSVK
jgi:hypothetical protein